MIEKIKIKVSTYLMNILENDALRFGFIKNGKSNKNALLNKLIPILVEVRKARRSEVENILTNEFNRDDSKNIYEAVNTVIDRVYFNGEELDVLEEYIWIRPSKENKLVYDEIQQSEIYITAQDFTTYIRGILNEYSRLPQYKREMLTFDRELDIFAESCYTNQIVHFYDKESKKRYRAFAYEYVYGYLYDQTNYCIIYDLDRYTIKSIPLYRIQDIYVVKKKYKPNEDLINKLQEYLDNCKFDEELYVEDGNVF